MLPPVPTDNLYKFVTVLGVALMVACIASITASRMTIAVEFAQTDVSLLENDALQARLTDLAVRTRSAIEAAEAGGPFPSGARDDLAEMKQLLPELIASNKKTVRDGSISVAKQRELQLTVKLMFTLLVVGFGMTALGAVFWWRNHQRYQDIIVRKQAEAVPLQD